MKYLLPLVIALFFIFHSSSFAQNAVHFDGVNDYIQTTFPAPRGTGSRTFEAWVNVDPAAPASNLCIMDYGLNAVGSRNSFSVGANRSIVFISGGTNANISSTPNVVVAGQWTHVAFVLDAGVGYLYVNGVQVGTGSLTTVNTPTGNQSLRIGQRVTGGTIPFQGAIDEVRVWSVARTATEILNNRNAEFCSIPAGLEAYYNFNQGTAGGSNSSVRTLYNAAATGNGTLTSFALSGTTSNWVTGAPVTPGLSLARITDNSCSPYMSPSGKYTWTTSGTYRDTISNSNSCDSLMTFSLTIGQTTRDTTEDFGCRFYDSPTSNERWTTSGTYYDTITNTTGCLSYYTYVLDVFQIDSTVTRNGNELTANEANGQYQWIDCNNGGAKIANANTQTFVPSEDGNYAVVVYKDSCVDTSICFEVTAVGIMENIPSELRIAPNPANDEVAILTSGHVKQVRIFNNQGQLVRVIERFNSNEVLDLSGIDKGIYFLEVDIDGQQFRKRLVKL